ncbi:MAG: hypothetical protein N7Q72_01710, partial [Spiroplasma sp. Tabriz.8]|nr:hypothetical protein [Spiroplasma sp. Tabriz.8]
MYLVHVHIACYTCLFITNWILSFVFILWNIYIYIYIYISYVMLHRKLFYEKFEYVPFGYWSILVPREGGGKQSRR